VIGRHQADNVSLGQENTAINAHLDPACILGFVAIRRSVIWLNRNGCVGEE
jgi:hypothetical protein